MGVSEQAGQVAERRKAAAVLRRRKESILRLWQTKMTLLAREKGTEDALTDPRFQQSVREFVDLLAAWLEGERGEVETNVFYPLTDEGRRYRLRMADITYLLLELRSAAKEALFGSAESELEGFRLARSVDDAIEAVLRQSADIYELAAEADRQTAQERLEDVFLAWDLEADLAETQSRNEVCSKTSQRLGQVWSLAACRWRVYDPSGGPAEDFLVGADLPVPLVAEEPRYLTGTEQEAGGTISLIERVRRRREAYVCDDVSTQPGIVDGPGLLQQGASSFACLPLTARGAVVGVLVIYGTETGSLGQADSQRLAGLAGVAALALDRTGRLELSERRLSEAEVISRIGQALLELPTREALLQGVAGALRAFRNYFDVSLFRVDALARECVLVAESGRERLYRPADYRQKVGEGFIGICAETGETIRAADLERDTRRLVAFEEEYRVRTELAVPVKRGHSTIGVMHFLSDREDDFPDSEVAALRHAAPHIGVALQNALMIDQRARDRYELEQAHQELANIIRSTAVGITGTDKRGVYTHWSPGCETLLGYRAKDVVGRRTPADFAPEHLDLADVLARCLQQGGLTQERQWRREDGQLRYVRETRVPMRDEDGRHVGFTAYLVDITEQKEAEDRLRSEHDTLQHVVGAMGAGLCLFDSEFRLQWANATVMGWFGFGAGAYGKQCREVFRCARQSAEECPLIAAARNGQAENRLHEFLDNSGLWHCYDQIVTPIRHGMTRYVMLSLDVTEQRRRAEQMALIRKLAVRIETTLDLERVLHMALTAVTAGHAIGFNRAFVFLLDDPGEYLEGTMAVGPVSAADAERIWSDLSVRAQTIDDVLDSAGPSAGDMELTARVRSLRVRTDDSDNALLNTLEARTTAHVADARAAPGRYGAVAAALDLGEFACVPLAVQEEPLGVMLADNKFSGQPIDRYQVEMLEMFARQASLAISNAKAYEQIRSQLAELSRARDQLVESQSMASVGRMAGHLAHEIRNPLTAIGGMAASIARRHQDDSTTHRNATIIYNEVRRLERTLLNVLDYTRPLQPRKQPVSANEVVRETIGQFGEQLEKAGVTVQLSLADDLPQVMADPQMIKQVVLNLVKNAMEAMEGVSDGRLSVQTQMADGRVTLAVSDTGCGIGADVADTLFSPFCTTKITGVGLGLSVSQRIVRQHGGEIRAESLPGSGSRFIVSLDVGNPTPETGGPT
jgi:PAS domain S-box-containing protein